MITSKQNALIKEIRSLADKKYRDRLNLFIIEGIKPVKEAVLKGISIREIVGTSKGINALNIQFSSVVEVSDEVFDYVSEESTPQGVLAVAFKPENKLVSPVGNCILLDGVSDPSNVGAIIRTAVASGYDTIYMTNDCADPYAQKAVRSSMSGVFRAKIVRGKIEDLLSVINAPIVVADMCGKNVFETQVKAPFCLVIGNEGHGISSTVRERASVTVSIPMENEMESLNASVSAGILMYALKK